MEGIIPTPAHNGGLSTLSLAKPNRDIAAPYQTPFFKPIIGSGSGASQQQSVAAAAVNALPDYTNFDFQPLESTDHCKFDTYVGPTPESNWVVPGKLLVGAYPASNDDAETLDLITSILRQGVTKFVCLQQEYRDGVTEEQWRSGQALRPYFHDVRSIVKKKSMLPCLQGYDIVSESGLSFVHFPIRDCGITDDGRVLELARLLVKAIAEGQCIYLHCWGGHGRTGTLVCIMLHLMYGMDTEEVFAYCQCVHDLRQCPVVVGSPQTPTQRNQVTRVINYLMANYAKSRLTLSQDSGGDADQQLGGRSPGGPRITDPQQLKSPRSTSKSDASGSEIVPGPIIHTAPTELGGTTPVLAQSVSPTPPGEMASDGTDGTTDVGDSIDSLSSSSGGVNWSEVVGAKVPSIAHTISSSSENSGSTDHSGSTSLDNVSGAGDAYSQQESEEASDDGEEGGRMRLGTVDESDLVELQSPHESTERDGDEAVQMVEDGDEDAMTDDGGEDDQIRQAEVVGPAPDMGAKPSYLRQWRGQSA